MKWWLVMSCLLGLWSVGACQRAPYSYQPLPAAAAAAPAGTPAGPQLVFLSFNMSTDATGGHRLEPLLVKAVPGQTSSVAEEDVTTPSYLLVTQLGADGRAVGPARRVAHPLVQDVESTTAAGALQRQLVVVPQAEFFIRLSRQPQARTVRFEEVGPAASRPLSVTFPLPE